MAEVELVLEAELIELRAEVELAVEGEIPA